MSRIDKENTDRTPPQIRIISPVASVRGVILVEAAEKITVIGQAIDENGVAEVLVNGNPARIQADGNFDGETILTGAENLITVRAFDKRGNQATKTFVVKRESTP